MGTGRGVRHGRRPAALQHRNDVHSEAGARDGVRSAFRFGDVLEGLRFVFRRRTVLGAISLDLFAVLFGGATAMMPIYASEVLHVGPVGYGVLRAAPGVGAALIGALLAFSPIQRNVGRWMFSGVARSAFATIVFGTSTDYSLSRRARSLLGAGDMISVFVRHLSSSSKRQTRFAAGSAP